NILELLVNDVPVELFTDRLQAGDNLCLLIVLDDADLRVVVVIVAQQDQIGFHPRGTAERLDGVRIEDDSGAFACLEIEERLAVPAEDDRLRLVGRDANTQRKPEDDPAREQASHRCRLPWFS